MENISCRSGDSFLIFDTNRNPRVTLYLRDYPNASQVSSTLGPFDITSSTTKQDTRARARSVALKVENTAVDQTWKLGTFRLDIQESGRR